VKLSASDGNRYILRYDLGTDEWEMTLMEAPARKDFPPDPPRRS